jgi:heme exporter protein C
MINYLANPERFMRFSKIAMPIFGVLAFLGLAIGYVWALIYAPADYQQSQTARIMFVHVPSAWVSVGAYSTMAIASIVYLVWRHNLADAAALVAAQIGAAFTALCLVTGAIWGRPTWGTWWEFDGRLTSVLVLFFLYLGYLALRSAISDPVKSGKAAAILCLVGTVNIPIIRFSVVWWNTLHQPAAVFRKGGSSLHPDILNPLLFNGAAFMLLFGFLMLLNLRTQITKKRIQGIESRLYSEN